MTMSGARGTYRTGRERVARILDAAHELFVANGYRATSLRDIARASGISHPALARHYPTKHEILTDLVQRLETRDGEWMTAQSAPASPADTARKNDATPGWVELFTALLGEATSPEHPAHELMKLRRRLGLRLFDDYFAILPGGPRSRHLEAIRFGATWDGLQILSLYFPSEIDIPAHLTAYEEYLRTAGIPPAPPAGGRNSAPAPAGCDGDPSPRLHALRCAAQLYASRGYYEASMQAVADAARITKAALIHIAPTKHALLDLVLTEVVAAPGSPGTDPGSWFHDLPARPRWRTAAEVVLMCEAITPTHPAHEFMRNRLAEARQAAQRDITDEGGPDEDGGHAADRLLALSLGILISWLYDPDDIDPRTAIEGGITGFPGASLRRADPASKAE